MKISVPPPLSEFLSAANATSNAAIALAGPAVQLVNDVDDMIRTRLWADDIGLDPIPAALAINSYFSFLGAVRVALSGQHAAIFPADSP